METLDFNPMTPFGCRPLSLQVVKTQQMVKGCPSGRAVHKWQVFRSICEAKARLGVSDRALAVLHALLWLFGPDPFERCRREGEREGAWPGLPHCRDASPGSGPNCRRRMRVAFRRRPYCLTCRRLRWCGG
jgi:hypothetical protein